MDDPSQTPPLTKSAASAPTSLISLALFAVHLSIIYALAYFCSAWLAGRFHAWIIPIVDPANRTSAFQFVFSHVFAFTFIPAIAAGFLAGHQRPSSTGFSGLFLRRFSPTSSPRFPPRSSRVTSRRHSTTTSPEASSLESSTTTRRCSHSLPTQMFREAWTSFTSPVRSMQLWDTVSRHW